MQHMVWLLFILLGIAIVSIGSAIKLSAIGPEVIKYQKEWVTVLLQASLIVVLGAVTTSVLELFKSGLQRSKDQSKLQFSAYSRLRNRYHKVKLIRRSFQKTKLLTDSDIQALNEIQLDLEGLRDESDLFRQSSKIYNALSQMEKYLNHVANNSKSQERATFQESDPPDNSFKVFSHPYHEASNAMRVEIAPPSLVTRIWHALKKPITGA
jgi:hypothetical protein